MKKRRKDRRSNQAEVRLRPKPCSAPLRPAADPPPPAPARLLVRPCQVCRQACPPSPAAIFPCYPISTDQPLLQRLSRQICSSSAPRPRPAACSLSALAPPVQPPLAVLRPCSPPDLAGLPLVAA
ncbi:hypothetical protein J5N97_024579 [Dioscorea zingiberensis]|uniref:Uncharacterized protein n=1 Tax=Dioscorea zingiberensis TaxID=325984 RepID=A0A9D5C857_9LILI|nr:hypothetical protein J5N97_024579 [Dioscorea zingiberensis]